MKLVRCNECGKWIGVEGDLKIDESDGVEHCPKCKGYQGLFDLDSECEFDDRELVELWLLFGDVPIDNDDCIEEGFLDFDAGTNRFAIWKWFDHHHSRGVWALICEAEEALFARKEDAK